LIRVIEVALFCAAAALLVKWLLAGEYWLAFFAYAILGLLVRSKLEGRRGKLVMRSDKIKPPVLSGRHFWIAAFVGLGAVLAIIFVNWTNTRSAEAQWLDEARAAVEHELPGATVERMLFPQSPLDAPGWKKPPYKELTVICGYANGRAFHYRVRERQLSIGAEGSRCEDWYY